MTRTLKFEIGSGFGLNRLINPGFRYSQRGSGVAIGGGFSYQTLDRWQVGHNAGDKLTQQTFHGALNPNNLSSTSLQFFTTHSGPAGDVLARQFIEDIHIRDVYGGPISIGVWVLSDSADTFRLSWNEAPSLNTFAGGSELVGRDFTIPNDGLTWYLAKIENIDPGSLILNGGYIQCQFRNFLNTSGSRSHFLAQAVVNKGKILAPFELFMGGFNYERELAANQRYYEKTYNLDVAPGTSTGIGRELLVSQGSAELDRSFRFKVRKRVAPAVVGHDVSNISGGFLATDISESGFSMNRGNGGNFQNSSFHYTADAEIG